MTAPRRIAFIGNSLPRRCGIATFTTDLQQAVATTSPEVETSIVAITDPGRDYAYPATVGFEIRQDELEDYVAAADWLNAGGFEAVSLQHEFGIFGGEAGGHILSLLKRLTVPIITTLHTVLAEPSPAQRHVTERLLSVSARVVVMAEKGRELLLDVYGADPAKLDVIAHGIPDFAFVESDVAKAELGFSGKTVILTFGLLSPNKGIEVMIDAMPAILSGRPDAVYVVLGATHPNLVRDEGEAYRNGLQRRAEELGLVGQVVFIDRFVDRPTLLQHIAMCDVYVTPYLNKSQMTSGTLAYSFGLGKAVVSTPYWHAEELLADGRGILVPFGDAAATGKEIAALLADEPRRLALRKLAYQGSREMTWERTAARYLETIDRSRPKATSPAPMHLINVRPAEPLPPLSLGHLEAMTDGTGLFQHAVHTVPDRDHGYCVDDNARALLLASSLAATARHPLPERMTSAYASFVQHAWNPDRRRFRNFMSFDRRWLEPQGSEDSHGRTLWALGVASRDDPSMPRRQWAGDLFREALVPVESFTSPRAWTFALLGLDAYCAVRSDDDFAVQLRLRLASRLITLLRQVETPDWIWFEEGLSYDNARLSEALIRCGRATGVAGYVVEGLRTLEWLMARQTSRAGLFRPVGSAGFQDVRSAPRGFDQQPVEAAATIAACLAAWRSTGEDRWQKDAARAFAWFLGRNDLGQPLVDTATGTCQDGLHPDRVNKNCGGESVLSYLLGLADMQQFERIGTSRSTPRLVPPRPRVQPFHPSQQFRGQLVASHLPEPAGTLPPA
ncbi:MAG: glycosyltransferase [Hyphomicrobiales bacterium]|nr:MAG: glycosyltransferase [Hyphomicrobiales bacterium]